MEVITWTDPVSGILVISAPAPGAQLDGESDGDFLARIQALVTPQGVTSQIVDASTIISTARVPRSIWAVYQDLLALTGAQKTNVWADLTSGSPAKITLDKGPHSDTAFVLHWAATNTSLPAASIVDAKVRAAAAYVVDNPKYLNIPAFDPTINVLGDQPA